MKGSIALPWACSAPGNDDGNSKSVILGNARGKALGFALKSTKTLVRGGIKKELPVGQLLGSAYGKWPGALVIHQRYACKGRLALGVGQRQQGARGGFAAGWLDAPGLDYRRGLDLGRLRA